MIAIDSLKIIFTSLVVFNVISIRDLLNVVCLIIMRFYYSVIQEKLRATCIHYTLSGKK